MNRNVEHRQNYFAWGCAAIGCVMLIAASWSAPTQVGVVGWPVYPKDTPTPGSRLVGGTIELHVSGSGQTARLFAVVQWQDGLGEWHDVDGWRGEIEGDCVSWDVAAKDFGTGPFRWLVYRDSSMLGTSESFNLPVASRQVIRVWVEIEP